MSTHQVRPSVLDQKEDQRSVQNLWLQEDNSAHPEKPRKERKERREERVLLVVDMPTCGEFRMAVKGERVGVGVVRDESGKEGRVRS